MYTGTNQSHVSSPVDVSELSFTDDVIKPQRTRLDLKHVAYHTQMTYDSIAELQNNI